MKVGDYIRDKRGMIAKIKKFWIYHNVTFIITDKDTISESIVVKSSPNIIDLIEIGDYVNGCLIVEISKDPFIKGQINLWTNMIISEGEPFPNEYYKAKILEKDIKSILTKEQFENCMYKIGE